MEIRMTNFIKFEIFPLLMAFLGNALFDEVALKFIFTILGMAFGTVASFYIKKWLYKRK